MAFTIRSIEYYHVSIKDRPGEAFELLSLLASQGIDLLAFTAVPNGDEQTQLTLFPDDGARFTDAARKANLEIDGPHPALLVRGDDELGAVASIHEKLTRADINVFSSTGIADGKGSYSYLVYVRPEKFQRAIAALQD